MILWWMSVALAADVELTALVGVRTAPDAALEQDDEWEPEVEPTALAALMGQVRQVSGDGWFGLDGSLWGLTPEGDASMAALGPRAGFGADVGDVRLDAAARYDAQLYPLILEASSGRAEAVFTGSWSAGAVRPELSVSGLDRHYPFRTEWSFRAAEPAVGLRVDAGAFRGRLGGSWQVNQTQIATGTQLRGTAEVGLGSRRVEVWAIYGLIGASGGTVQSAARAQFTAVGDYSADADALSAGGFLQHRGEVGISATLDPWTLRASAMGRIRDSVLEDRAAFDRTLHGQVDLERSLSDTVSAVATGGGSGAGLPGGRGYVDIYGWAGLSWRPDAGATTEPD